MEAAKRDTHSTSQSAAGTTSKPEVKSASAKADTAEPSTTRVMPAAPAPATATKREAMTVPKAAPQASTTVAVPTAEPVPWEEKVGIGSATAVGAAALAGAVADSVQPLPTRMPTTTPVATVATAMEVTETPVTVARLYGGGEDKGPGSAP